MIVIFSVKKGVNEGKKTFFQMTA